MTNRTFNQTTGRISTIAAGASNAVANFSYTFDLIGDLTQRVDSNLSRTDNFNYDALNRLSTYSLAGGATQTMGYNALGDITSKPGIGTYNYPTAGAAHPHAISSITGTVRGVTNPNFSYDADGNMLSGPATSIGYTSYDMPSLIATNQGAPLWGTFIWGPPTNWTNSLLFLSYDSEHQRVEMNTPSAATFYFNDPVSGMRSELYIPSSGPSQWRSYVTVSGSDVAEQTAISGGSTTMQYFVADHLGSIAVVEDASGNVLQRLLYDPWGEQLDQSGNPLCGSGVDTTRGYTGEEQMPVDCLVNLNARVYDPILGRFVSADPVTGSIFDQRMLNPYSYVLDNPLSLTDPTGACGFWCDFEVVLLVGPVGLLVLDLLKPELEHNPILADIATIAAGIACGPGGPACAAAVSGAIAGVESGNAGKGLEAFALSFAEAEAFNLVGGNLQGLQKAADAPNASFGAQAEFYSAAFIEHGLVGGTFSALQGGHFGSGFLAAGVSELATPYIYNSTQGNPALGTVEAAIVGGTTSVIGGGKFGNGAITGAFGYLYNQLNHAKTGTCGYFPGGNTSTCTGVTSSDKMIGQQMTAIYGGIVAAGVTIGRALPLLSDLLPVGAEATIGLPPPGVVPPVADPGELTVDAASRSSAVGSSLYDESGGEWRYFPEDEYHNPHWDYNPWTSWNSPWENVPIGGKPPVKP